MEEKDTSYFHLITNEIAGGISLPLSSHSLPALWLHQPGVRLM